MQNEEPRQYLHRPFIFRRDTIIDIAAARAQHAVKHSHVPSR